MEVAEIIQSVDSSVWVWALIALAYVMILSIMVELWCLKKAMDKKILKLQEDIYGLLRKTETTPGGWTTVEWDYPW